MKYKNIKYINKEEYNDIKNRAQSITSIYIEIDGKKIQNKKQLFALFKRSINAPNHYFSNLDAFNDLLYDFFDLDNQKSMLILIRNCLDNKFLLDNIVLFNDAIEYWKTHNEATLSVWVLEENDSQK